MNNHGGSKTEAIVKLVLIFFISLFSFSVGTFVGKQVSDSDRKRIALEAEYGKVRTTASAEKPEIKGAITEDEVNKLTREFLKAEADLAKHHSKTEKSASAKANPPTRNVASTNDSGFIKRVRRRIAEKTEILKELAIKRKKESKIVQSKGKLPEVTDRAAKNRAPSPKVVKKKSANKLTSASIGKYTVQIASYTTESEAKSHVQSLKKEGYSAFYLSARVKDKVWYRVSIGLFDSLKSANNFKSEILKQASISSALVQKIIR